MEKTDYVKEIAQFDPNKKQWVSKSKPESITFLNKGKTNQIAK